MTNMKLLGLAATVSVAAIATSAQAQFVWPAVQLKGAGASSIVTAHGQVANCIAQNDSQVGLPAAPPGAGFQSIPAASFDWVAGGTANPDFNCATEFLQPNWENRYIATGSGTGRTWWRTLTNQLTGTNAAGSNNNNPFVLRNGEPAWTNLQYAFSDTPVSFSDLSGYNTTAEPTAGAAIQLPLYALPVALAYENVYGTKVTAGGTVNLEFNYGPNRLRTSVTGAPIGGLRMDKNTYCKIFNGEITNWNATQLQALNGNTPLFDTTDDTAARWAAEGAPIRLVGRLDRSGTTDIFTRHLAEACDSFVTLNKYEQAAESLPFFPSYTAPGKGSPVDMELVAPGAGTRYRPTTAVNTGSPTVTPNFANSTNDPAYNSISGAYFVRGSAPANDTIDTTQGDEALGLFLLANGSTSVERAIQFPADRQSTQDPNVKLNGKLGYVGADFVAPTAGKTLFSAALQQGTGTTYVMADAYSAQRPLLDILPPEQTTANGRWTPAADTRTAPDAAGVPQQVERSNPKSWTDVLTNTPGTSIANPTRGYPILGTTQILTYTCFSNVAKRNGVAFMLAAYMSRITAKSDGSPFSSLTFTLADNPAVTPYRGLGTIAQTGLAAMPEPWQAAYYITFLQNSPQASDENVTPKPRLGQENLWLNERLPTRANQVDGVGLNEIASNPTCANKAGA